MKKLILFMLLQMAFAIIHAQESKEPTKQETMDWIAGKMRAHLDGEGYFVSYENGFFKYRTIVRGNKSGQIRGQCFFTINLNKIAKIDISWGCTYFSASGVNIMYRTSACILPSGWDQGKVEQNSVTLNNRNDGPFDFCVEEGLYDRMVKAFSALIKYNTQKKEGEAF